MKESNPYLNDYELKRQINDTVKEIKKNTMLRKHVEETLNEWKVTREFKSAERGMKGAAEARVRLKE
jgi:hypothetical protein